MLYLIDKLIIFLIYVIVLLPKVNIASLPVNKVLFLVILLFYAAYSLGKAPKIPTSSLRYITASIGFILALATVSIIFGNPPEDVSEFVFSLAILLVIPVFYLLLGKYSVERYIGHVIAAATVLSLYVILMYAYFLQYPTWNPMAYVVNETQVLGTTVLYREGGVLQVSVVMSGWLCVAAVMAFRQILRKLSFWRVAAFVLFLFALFVNRTIGLWLSTLAGVAVVAFSHVKFDSKKILILSVLLILVVGSSGLLLDDILSSKDSSITQKGEQTIQAIQIFLSNMMFGKGLGYRYYPSDIPSLSGDSNVYLEVTYPMILSSTGLVGVLCYGFIFLYYAIRFLASPIKTSSGWLLFACYFSVLIAAIGNPFLWGGGMGLFLVSMLAASLETSKRLGSQGKKLVNRRGRPCA